MDRRTFIALSAAAIGLGCDQIDQSDQASAHAETSRAAPPAEPADEKVVDAWPLTIFADEKVYDEFRQDGFFLVKREGQLFALSSVCTHKGCKVRPQDDGSYICKCHRSAFDEDGRVLNGPAKRDLPRLAVKSDSEGHVLVNVSRKLLPGEPTSPPEHSKPR